MRTRISSTRLFATAASAIGGAAAVMLTATLALAQDPMDTSLDLPVEPKPLVKPQPPRTDEPTEQGDEKAPTIFGTEIKTDTQSIVYCVDQSGSMSLSVAAYSDENGNTVTGGTRWDRARSEIRRSISTLPESFKFNVIFFDECIRCWNTQVVAANSANKTAAFGWINGQEPLGFTNTGLAVATGLGDKTNKMIVLLSDGEPNFLDCASNYVGSYDQHRQLIKTSNSQGARVDCFAIGVEGNPDARKFMQDVASDNSGTYTECN
jgi:hypothetical protein